MDEEDTDNVVVCYERGLHWSIYFEDNKGGRYDKKCFLHAKRGGVYMMEIW